MEQIVNGRDKTMAGYFRKYLGLARRIVWLGLVFIVVVGVVTVVTLQKTANINYSIAHAFIPVK